MSWHENDIMDQNANGDAKGNKEIRIKRETWTIKRVYGRIGYQTF